jgi:BlaI family transcriptional regulator, penicillinase repressor
VTTRSRSSPPPLSRRERQIMDVIYRLGRATAAEVHAALPDAPSYSTVRALLKVLETKGHLRHAALGPRYVFTPTVPRERARESALRQVVGTFFEGSTEAAVAALLGLTASQLSDAELNRLAGLIARAKQEGR